MVEIFSASPRNFVDGSISAFEYDEIIQESDRTSFGQATDRGQGQRTVFDRREGFFSPKNVHLFDVQFTDSSNVIEYQVSTELSFEEAQEAVDKYGKMYGRLPAFTRENIDKFVIFPGTQNWGANQVDSSINVSTEIFSNDRGSEEEILLHEAGHVISTDPGNPIWQSWGQAIADDGDRYLNEYSTTIGSNGLPLEDFSENFVMWYGIRTGDITGSEAEDIENFVPNRFQLLDQFYGNRIDGIALNSVTNSFQPSQVSNDNPIEEGLTSSFAASLNALNEGTDGDNNILGTADEFELGGDLLSQGANLTSEELSVGGNNIQFDDSVLANLNSSETTDLNANNFAFL